MKKKIFVSLLILFLLAIAGGIFWHWQNQKDVRDINKTLPEGVKVAKSLFGKDYTVVNKIDGYEFKVPKAWEGIEKIEYVPEEIVMGIKTTGIGIEGKIGGQIILSIDVYFLDTENLNLFEQSQKIWTFFELSGDLIETFIGEFKVVKAQENIYLGGTYVYFFSKGNKMYVLNNGSEEFIQEIILNGKW